MSRLFVVTKTASGTRGEYMTRDDLQRELRQDWEKKTVREPWDPAFAETLDQRLLSTIATASVGEVIPWRMGWVFIATSGEDGAAGSGTTR